MQCPRCKTDNNNHSQFCKKCGSKLSKAPIICPDCNMQNEPNAKYCDRCGTKFQASKYSIENAVKTLSETPKETITKYLRYGIVAFFVLIMFLLSFGSVIEYRDSTPDLDLIGRPIQRERVVSQNSSRILLSSYEILRYDQAEVGERFSERRDDLISRYGPPESPNDENRFNSRLNMLSFEYFTYPTATAYQLVILVVIYTLLILAIQLLPLIVLILCIIRFKQKKRLGKIPYLFVLMSSLVLILRFLQIVPSEYRMVLGRSYRSYMILGFLAFALYYLNAALESVDAKKLANYWLTPKTALHIGSVILGFLVILLSLSTFVSMRYNYEGFRTTRGTITLNDVMTNLKYNNETVELLDETQATTVLRNDLESDWTAEDQSMQRTTLARTYNFEVLFMSELFEARTTQHSITTASSLLFILLGFNLVYYQAILFVSKAKDKTNLKNILLISQALIVSALIALSTILTLQINTLLETGGSLAKASISIPLVFALIFIIGQFIINYYRPTILKKIQ